MNLTELQTAWNELRNAALGRGTTPLVPQPLADRVGNSYERWRAWLASWPPWKLQEVAIEPLTAPEPWAWFEQYRALSAEVQAALKKRGNTAYKPMPDTFVEKVQRLPGQLGDGATNVLWAVAAIGVFTLAVSLFSATQRGGRS